MIEGKTLIEDLIAEVIRREGGYVNHPADKGGPTNMGITLETLGKYRNNEVTADDVQKLTRAEAENIYYLMYWRQHGLHTVTGSIPVQGMLLDAAVHHGPRTAIKLLQRAIETSPDGVIGPKTRAAADAMDPRELAAALVAARAIHYGKILERSPGQSVFAEGWMTRLAEFIEKIPEI